MENQPKELILEKQLQEQKAFIDESLRQVIENLPDRENDLVRAMSYSLQAEGKRFRPLLMIAFGESLNINREALRPFLCAMECIHCYSLVHDDLPAMDNDDFRRGKPTNHKVFGEAMAILAGDALQTLAFQICSEKTRFLPEQQLQAIHFLSNCAGSMVNGQALDMSGDRGPQTLTSLEKIHAEKTGKLIVASICIPAILAGAPEILQFRTFAEKLGKMYQIQDDLLDVIGDEKTMGKKTDKDREQNKLTYPGLLGIEESKEWVERLFAECEKILSNLPYPTDLPKFLLNKIRQRIS